MLSDSNEGPINASNGCAANSSRTITTEAIEKIIANTAVRRRLFANTQAPDALLHFVYIGFMSCSAVAPVGAI